MPISTSYHSMSFAHSMALTQESLQRAGASLARIDARLAGINPRTPDRNDHSSLRDVEAISNSLLRPSTLSSSDSSGSDFEGAINSSQSQINLSDASEREVSANNDVGYFSCMTDVPSSHQMESAGSERRGNVLSRIGHRVLSRLFCISAAADERDTRVRDTTSATSRRGPPEYITVSSLSAERNPSSNDNTSLSFATEGNAPPAYNSLRVASTLEEQPPSYGDLTSLRRA